MNNFNIKDYFTKGNITIILGILFTGISYWGIKVYDCKEKIFSDYNNAINNMTVSNEEMLNSKIVGQFTSDSLLNIGQRIKEYGLFLIIARKYPTNSYITKSIDLQRSVLDDIARLSKFKNIKQSDQFPNGYLSFSEYLIEERKMVQLMHKYSVAVETKSYNSAHALYGEMESTFFELEGLNKKILIENKLAIEQIPQQKEKFIKNSANFQAEIEKRKESLKMYSLICLFCTIAWVIIFILAIKYETFKKQES